ncbi:MAG TPA: Do family serine endopeptidase [Prosthecobacter sp.]|nr:Do family serine endopeptidase [Prosthecobacter sp.]
MKHIPLLTLALASALPCMTGAQENGKPAGISAAEFHSRLTRDAAPLPDGGQLKMSYADVVDKILPSVVTIFSKGGKSGAPDVEDIPPNLRPFFYHFFGVPPPGEDEEEPAPRGRRGAPRQAPPREMPQQRGVGSGFIISQDGYIITNNHVIADAEEIQVAVEHNGSSKNYNAEVIGADPLTDVALIKIEASGLPTAVIADSDRLRVGDIVLAAGAPMELNRSVTQGIVSALGRTGLGIVGKGNMAGYEDFIQTDASINPGNSGGPLVDALGRVVGINTAILSRSGGNIGIGFAIPMNMALKIVEDLIDSGSVQRGYLGVLIGDLDDEKASVLGLKDQGGALITKVGAESPAEKAGLEVGDVVVAVNGQRIDTSAKLRLIVSSQRPGTEVALDVLREGAKLTLKARLEELPQEALAQINRGGELPRKGGSGVSNAEIVPGVTVQNLTPATRERYDVPADVQGVVVTTIDTESRAAAMGIEEGDVIQQVNRKPVRAVGEAVELAKNSVKTVLLRVYRKGDTMLFMVNQS